LLWQQLRHPFVIPFLGIDSETFPPFSCMVLPWMEHGTILKHLEDTGNLNIDTRVCFLSLVCHAENTEKFVSLKDLRSRARSGVSSLTAHCTWRPSWCKWLGVFPVDRLLKWLFFKTSPIFSSMKLGTPSLLISGWPSSSTQPQTRHTAVGPQDGWHRNLAIPSLSNWDSLVEPLLATFMPLHVLA